MITQIKTISDSHLTAHNKKHICHLINSNIDFGKIGRTIYSINPTGKGDDILQVVISQNDRGLISCGGSPLRMSSHKHEIQVR